MKNKEGIAIIIMGGRKPKDKMNMGGMASGKKHMYVGDGSVTDNAGLIALKKASPEAYMNIKKNG